MMVVEAKSEFDVDMWLSMMNVESRLSVEQTVMLVKDMTKWLNRVMSYKDNPMICREVLGYKSNSVIQVSVNSLIRRVEDGDTSRLMDGLKRIKKCAGTGIHVSEMWDKPFNKDLGSGGDGES